MKSIFQLVLLVAYFLPYLFSKPNVVIFYVDDLGFNDVGFHGNLLTKTPHIDRLAHNGVILTRYYGLPFCSPSRASLMTGRYPIHTGILNLGIPPNEPYGLPLNFSIFSNHLKSEGYATHVIGKWHLGFYMKEFVPTMRGFDTFFGFYGGSEDYFTHSISMDGVNFGLDFHDDVGEELSPAWDYFGQYSTDIFADRAQEIINTHKFSEKPLFLYLPFQGVHEPLQAKDEDIKYFEGVWDFGKYTYYAQMKAVDDAIGRVVESLHKNKQLDNTIIFFASDNGGQSFNGLYASNYPLRSGKTYLFEGGVRLPAFVFGPGLKGPSTYDNYIHVTDLLPTIFNAIGGDISQLGEIDGINQWESLLEPQSTKSAPRNEVLLNIDPINGEAALIQGNYKLYTVLHTLHKEDGQTFDQWYSYEGPMNETDRIRRPSIGDWTLPVVYCERTGDETECDLTNGVNKYCLFDIIKDPCEYDNIASKNEDIVAELSDRLNFYGKSAMPPVNEPADPMSSPKYHNNAWMPWVTSNI